jgi:hypothetical protein
MKGPTEKISQFIMLLNSLYLKMCFNEQKCIFELGTVGLTNKQYLFLHFCSKNMLRLPFNKLNLVLHKDVLYQLGCLCVLQDSKLTKAQLGLLSYKVSSLVNITIVGCNLSGQTLKRNNFSKTARWSKVESNLTSGRRHGKWWHLLIQRS